MTYNVFCGTLNLAQPINCGLTGVYVGLLQTSRSSRCGSWSWTWMTRSRSSRTCRVLSWRPCPPTLRLEPASTSSWHRMPTTEALSDTFSNLVSVESSFYHPHRHCHHLCCYYSYSSYSDTLLWGHKGKIAIASVDLPLFSSSSNNNNSSSSNTHSTQTTTILWLSVLCPGQPEWSSTRRYILPSSRFSGANWR